MTDYEAKYADQKLHLITFATISAISDEQELLWLIGMIMDARAHIAEQLDQECAHAERDGEIPDASWMAAANRARSGMGKVLLWAQERRAVVLRYQRAKQHGTAIANAAFRRAARQVLDVDTMARVSERASALLAEG